MQNEIRDDQLKLTNINDLIATIQSQIVQANALQQSAKNNNTDAEASVLKAQKQINDAISSETHRILSVYTPPTSISPKATSTVLMLDSQQLKLSILLQNRLKNKQKLTMIT